MGNKDEPWGMPVFVVKVSELQPGRHRVVVLLLMKLPTYFTIHSGNILSLMMRSSRARTTLSKAPVMSSNSSIATPIFVLPCCMDMLD